MQDQDPDRDPGEHPLWWEGDGAAQPDWRPLFAEGSPREVLHRLVEGDPLDLLEFSWDRIWGQAIMLEPERLFLRTAAGLARVSSSYAGVPELADYVRGHLDQAIEHLLEEDRECEGTGQPIHPEDLPGFIKMIPRETGIEPQRTRRASVSFNAMREKDRCDFFHIVIGGMTAEEYAEEMGRSMEAITASIEQATMRMVRATDGNQNPTPDNHPKNNDPWSDGGTR